MTENYIIFDVDEFRPACVILQAAMGGDMSAARKFPSESWLLTPTPGMRKVKVDEDLPLLVEAVKAKMAVAAS